MKNRLHRQCEETKVWNFEALHVNQRFERRLVQKQKSAAVLKAWHAAREQERGLFFVVQLTELTGVYERHRSYGCNPSATAAVANWSMCRTESKRS